MEGILRTPLQRTRQLSFHPVTNPPHIVPSITNPPVTFPPPSTTYPSYTGNPPSQGGSGGGVGSGGGADGGGGVRGGRGGSGGSLSGMNPAPSAQPTCPVDSWKSGLCVDALGRLVHIGIGDPVVNVCCLVLGGLLSLEAAICLCIPIRIKLLNLNIYLPIALQALITCGVNPLPVFLCPRL